LAVKVTLPELHNVVAPETAVGAVDAVFTVTVTGVRVAEAQ